MFLGLPKMSFEERVGAMQAFMLAHFPQITFCDCSVYFALNMSSRKWEETNTGYIQVSSRAVRDRIFQEMEDKAVKFMLQGKHVTIKKAR